jgi:hypothetical protein
MSLFSRLFIAGLALAVLAGAAQAAPTTYVHPSAPSCGGPSPCYSSLHAAIQNTDNGGTVIVLTSLATSVTQTFGKTGITIRGNTPSVAISGVFIQALVNGWTIRDLSMDSGLSIRDVAGSLTISGITLTGPGIGLGDFTQNPNATINISNITFAGAPNRGIQITGGTGVNVGGNITMNNVSNAFSCSVFGRVSAGAPANVTANVTLSNSTFPAAVPGAGAVVAMNSDGSGGSGNITGTIRILNNTMDLVHGGIGVIVIGGVTGDISGPVVMTGNHAHRLVVNTLDGTGGAVGNVQMDGNQIEVIEIIAKNAPLVGPVVLTGNHQVDQPDPTPQNASVAVDGVPVLGNVTIENNTGVAFISTSSTGAPYQGPVRINNNACKEIALDSQGGSITQPFTITGNSLPPGTSPDGVIVVRALNGGSFAGGTLSGNVVDGFLFDIAGGLTAPFAVTSNATRELASFNCAAGGGAGTLTMTGNNFTGHTHLRGMTTTARFNRFFNSAAFPGAAAVDARYNWWGCNTGPGTPGCTGGTGSAAINPWLVFTATTRCAGPTSATQILDLRTAVDGSLPAGNVTPAVGSVASTQGTFTPPVVGFLGVGTSTLTLPPAAAPTITTQLDSVGVTWPGRCDPDISGVALYAPANAVFRLRNRLTTGPEDAAFGYGPAGAVPLMGDWDGNGSDTPGIYDPATATFVLRNWNTAGFGEIGAVFGPAGAVPLAGDWNGDGVVTIGAYQPSTSTFFLRNTNSTGAADATFTFESGGVPVVGDWDGDGDDTVGLYIPSTSEFHLRNSNSAGAADLVFVFGTPGSGQRPVAGDWNGDGVSSPGLYAPATSTWILRNSNSTGGPDLTFDFGVAGAGWVPLAGDFDGPRTSNPALSVGDVAVTEGNSGTRTANFTVRLAPTSGGTVRVNYATANGTATAGSDYNAISGTVTFNAGESTKTVPVTINSDTTSEANESFFLDLSAPMGAALADNQALGTILDDDASGYFPVAPCRLADTRGAAGPSGGPALAAQSARAFPVTGLCGIPAGARTVAINVTVVGATQDGNLRLYATAGPVPLASTINFRGGRTRANNAIVTLGSGGQLTVQNDMTAGSTHVVLDVVGYFR